MGYTFNTSHKPLSSTDLVTHQPGLIISISDFLTVDECERLIHLADAQVQPPSKADLVPKKNEAFLNRDTALIVDGLLAACIWDRLMPHLPDIDGRVPIGLHGDGRRGGAGQIKLYRYAKGQQFGLHVDQSWKGEGPGEETEYTFLVYLNSRGEPADGRTEGGEQPLLGGDTVFMKTAKVELCRVAPERGLGLLHAHGRRCLLHEGEEVRRGVKYLLRADIMYRRQVSEVVGPTAAKGGRAGGRGGGRGGRRGGGRSGVHGGGHGGSMDESAGHAAACDVTASEANANGPTASEAAASGAFTTDAAPNSGASAAPPPPSERLDALRLAAAHMPARQRGRLSLASR